jgi:hypothetical protein
VLTTWLRFPILDSLAEDRMFMKAHARNGRVIQTDGSSWDRLRISGGRGHSFQTVFVVAVNDADALNQKWAELKLIIAPTRPDEGDGRCRPRLNAPDLRP